KLVVTSPPAVPLAAIPPPSVPTGPRVRPLLERIRENEPLPAVPLLHRLQAPPALPLPLAERLTAPVAPVLPLAARLTGVATTSNTASQSGATHAPSASPVIPAPILARRVNLSLEERIRELEEGEILPEGRKKRGRRAGSHNRGRGRGRGH
ncbi:hypothetical protein B0H16DRAFT_1485012, partial [Mycena metata]